MIWASQMASKPVVCIQNGQELVKQMKETYMAES